MMLSTPGHAGDPDHTRRVPGSFAPNPNPNPADELSDVPWPTSRERLRAPDDIVPPRDEPTAAPAVGLLQQAVQGAHDTIDRLADRAAPAVQELQDSVAAAEETLQLKAGELRNTGEQWLEAVRSAVRDHPLLCMAAALALGGVLAHIARSNPSMKASPEDASSGAR